MTNTERFMSQVRVVRRTGCWRWKGLYRGQLAVFVFLTDGVVPSEDAEFARRWAFERFAYPLPEDRYVLPFCGDHKCLNPRHQVVLSEWELLVQGPSLLRGECPDGHPFTASNLIRTGEGVVCRTCHLGEYHPGRRLGDG